MSVATRGDNRAGGLRRSWMWPGMVFGLLLLNVALVAQLLHGALSGGSLGLEPDYYQRAQSWDRVQAQQAVNERLGWVISAAVDPAAAERTLTIHATDRDGLVITGARVQVEMFAHADAGRRMTTLATEREPGVYFVDQALGRAGLWQVRLTVARGAERFTAVRDLMVEPGAGVTR